MRIRSILLLICLQFTMLGIGKAQKPTEIIYKQIDTVKLKMVIYKPEDFNASGKYTTIAFFFGGGWNSGKITQFEDFAKYYVAKGMIAILVDYRVKSRQGTTPIEALKDAKSAIRYLRKNASNLGIDPDKIVASGGSAGGHLAAACYTNETFNETNDDMSVSSKPNALVLFNPVVDNSETGYGYDRVKDYYQEFSPLHNIRKGFPPTVFFLGTSDKLVPVSTGQDFKKRIESVGGRCELYLYKDQEHGFFNQKTFHEDIFSKIDAFFRSIGFMN